MFGDPGHHWGGIVSASKFILSSYTSVEFETGRNSYIWISLLLCTGAYGAAVLYRKKDDDSLVILKEINMHDLTAQERQFATNEVWKSGKIFFNCTSCTTLKKAILTMSLFARFCETKNVKFFLLPVLSTYGIWIMQDVTFQMMKNILLSVGHWWRWCI